MRLIGGIGLLVVVLSHLTFVGSVRASEQPTLVKRQGPCNSSDLSNSCTNIILVNDKPYAFEAEFQETQTLKTGVRTTLPKQRITIEAGAEVNVAMFKTRGFRTSTVVILSATRKAPPRPPPSADQYYVIGRYYCVEDPGGAEAQSPWRDIKGEGSSCSAALKNHRAKVGNMTDPCKEGAPGNYDQYIKWNGQRDWIHGGPCSGYP